MASYLAVVDMVDAGDSDHSEPLEITISDRRRGLVHRVAIEQFTGGHLLHLAVAGCVFNDLVRESRKRGITLTRISVGADGGFTADPCESTGIDYWIDIEGDASEHELNELVEHVEQIAEIPSALRRGGAAQLTRRTVVSSVPSA